MNFTQIESTVLKLWHLMFWSIRCQMNLLSKYSQVSGYRNKSAVCFAKIECNPEWVFMITRLYPFSCEILWRVCNFWTFEMAAVTQVQNHLGLYYEKRCSLPLTMFPPCFIGITKTTCEKSAKMWFFFQFKMKEWMKCIFIVLHFTPILCKF